MTRAPRLGLAALATCVLGSVSLAAHAEPPNGRATPVYVLPLWTDDADDQADALTQALRSRVRQAAGWSLLETSQSFETLAIALKCPTKPDAPCLQRIGDQLHADHYVWGTMAKRRGAGEVSAEVHLWSRGKPESDASESYSENLKDASDESLRGVAARLFAKMTGASVGGGAIVVHAGRSSGTVLVDGVEKAALDNGTVRIEVPAGSHTVAVRIAGSDVPAQTAEVASGSEQDLTFAPVASRPASAEPEETSRSSFPITKVLGYSAIVAGAGFLVAGGIEALNWISDSNQSSDDRKMVPTSVTDVCTASSPAAIDACNKSKDAVTVSTLGWIFTGAGALLVGTGIVLVAKDHGASDASRSATAHPQPRPPRVDLLPALGPRAGSLDLRVRF